MNTYMVWDVEGRHFRKIDADFFTPGERHLHGRAENDGVLRFYREADDEGRQELWASSAKGTWGVVEKIPDDERSEPGEQLVVCGLCGGLFFASQGACGWCDSTDFSSREEGDDDTGKVPVNGSKWIRADDQQPKHDGHQYLVANERGDMDVLVWTYHGDWRDRLREVRLVQFWQPLPAPPGSTICECGAFIYKYANICPGCGADKPT